MAAACHAKHTQRLKCTCSDSCRCSGTSLHGALSALRVTQRYVSAQVTHLIFKRWEHMNVPIISLLLFFIPLGLSALLVGQLGYFKAIALTFVSYFTTLNASIIAYRLSPFHSFARYPGPILAKMSKLWYTWQISGGKQYLYQEYLHDKYGDVVRIGKFLLLLRISSSSEVDYGYRS